MLHIYLGPDTYSKKQEMDSLVREKKADLVVYGETDETPGILTFLETDLFSNRKVFVLNKPLDFSVHLEKVINSPNIIIISVESFDRRKKENKGLLSNNRVLIKDFVLPHGKELDLWLLQRAGELGGGISQEAANELAIRLGRDLAKEVKAGGKVVSTEEVYSLWQAESELKKLLAYASGQQISKGMVEEMIQENGETDAFSITNAIAEKNKDLTFGLISKFLTEQTASDEKAGVIQLTALLAEQFRNIHLTQELLSQKISEEEILEKTGWKSGRVFIMKKTASRFKRESVLDLLRKLPALDEELKSGSVPPRVMLDLILAQLF